MLEINITPSDANLASLVREAISHGEAVTLLDAGRPVADIIPRAADVQERRDEAADTIMKIRAGVSSKISLDDLCAARHEGHNH